MVKMVFKKESLFRVFYYCVGLVCLAFGVTLNTKTGLGVSPLISVPNSLCDIFGWNLGNTVAVYYVIMVLAQIPLKGKKFRWVDFLQAPMSIFFTRLINFFNAALDFTHAPFVIRLALVALAILFTGWGVVFTVNMEIVPNAADGFVAAISERTGKDMGFVKNMMDLTCVIVTCIIGLVLIRRVICVGVGTLMTVLGVGRVVAITNRMVKRPIRKHAGLENN